MNSRGLCSADIRASLTQDLTLKSVPFTPRTRVRTHGRRRSDADLARLSLAGALPPNWHTGSASAVSGGRLTPAHASVLSSDLAALCQEPGDGRGREGWGQVLVTRREELWTGLSRRVEGANVEEEDWRRRRETEEISLAFGGGMQHRSLA